MTPNKTGGSAAEPHPKLEMAAKEINDILKKHDIAGVVILHTIDPTPFKKIHSKLDTSYSVVKIEAGGRMKVLNPIVDPANPGPANKKIADTVNMLANMQSMAGQMSLVLQQACAGVQIAFGLKTLPPQSPKPLNGKL